MLPERSRASRPAIPRSSGPDWRSISIIGGRQPVPVVLIQVLGAIGGQLLDTAVLGQAGSRPPIWGLMIHGTRTSVGRTARGRCTPPNLGAGPAYRIGSRRVPHVLAETEMHFRIYARFPRASLRSFFWLLHRVLLLVLRKLPRCGKRAGRVALNGRKRASYTCPPSGRRDSRSSHAERTASV